MLTSTLTGSPSSAIDCSIAPRTRRTTSSTCIRRAWVTSTANSSPPSRAIESPSRSASWRRRLTSRSSRSPLAWPRVSLTSLKRSRSIMNTASSLPSRAAAEMACTTLSWKWIRFGSPVSESCRAWWRSCLSAKSRDSSAAFWRVMSRMTPSSHWRLPSGPTTARPCSAIHRGSPLTGINRYSRE